LRRFLPAALALFALALTPLGGCDFTEGFDEDPNLATDAPPQRVLTAAEVGVVQFQTGDFARLAGIFGEVFTGSDRQYSRINTGAINADDFNNSWNLAYEDVLNELQFAQTLYETEGNEVGAAVAKFHMALTYGQLAALFGDIPFTDALQGEENLTPSYTSQAEAYAGVIQMLDEVIATLSATDVSVNANAIGDIFYGGLDVVQPYLEAAQTAKARFCLHLADFECAYDAAQNGISDPALNLEAPFGGNAQSDRNVFYEFVAVQRGGYLTASNALGVRFLTEGSDRDRTDEFTDESARRDFYYVGEINNAELNTSGAFAPAASAPILTYRENLLILAESALQLGLGTDIALDALNDVRARLQEIFPEGTYETYPDDFFDSDEALLEEVLEEYYLTLIGNIEVYNLVRRTDNALGLNGRLDGRVPTRFIYGADEINANPNVPSPLPGPTDETAVFAGYDYENVGPGV
jgi:hypothetical protein